MKAITKKVRSKKRKPGEEEIKELSMKEKVGETAGKIWGILRQEEEINISNLSRMVKEKSDVVYQALGWLAREEKIIHKEKNNKVYVSLTEEEKKVKFE